MLSFLVLADTPVCSEMLTLHGTLILLDVIQALLVAMEGASGTTISLKLRIVESLLPSPQLTVRYLCSIAVPLHLHPIDASRNHLPTVLWSRCIPIVHGCLVHRQRLHSRNLQRVSAVASRTAVEAEAGLTGRASLKKIEQETSRRRLFL